MLTLLTIHSIIRWLIVLVALVAVVKFAIGWLGGGAFNIFLLRQFFAQIPEELWDAARIDGADHLRFLRSVVVPLSKAPIMTTVTFSFIGSWNALLWPLLVTQTDDWRPVAVGLTKFINNEASSDLHLQMAAAVMMIIPILIMYFFTQKQFTEGIATSGLKG